MFKGRPSGKLLLLHGIARGQLDLEHQVELWACGLRGRLGRTQKNWLRLKNSLRA